MKKGIFIGVLIVGTAYLINGCGKSCKGVDCPNLNIAVFMFRITNNSGKDLLIGPAKIYDTTQLKITAKNKQTGTLQNVPPNFYTTGDTSLTTTFSVSNVNTVYYLSLNNVVTDSMFFTYKYLVDDCCDRSYYYMNRFNTTDLTTTVTLPNLPGYLIKK
ncbi:MAG: hypothetical protein QM725_05065 [Lacibacter sp.]